MGSIQSKRGSVRQAPPDVYLPFLSGENEHDVGKACEEVGRDTLLFMLMLCIFGGLMAVWEWIKPR